MVKLMNEKAKLLGLTDTEYHSVHGLPPAKGEKEDLTSCNDLAILAQELLKYPKLMEWTSTKTDSFRDGKFVLTNTNKLLTKFSGTDGLKTGYYRESGFNIVVTAKRGELRFIAVVMGSPSGKIRDDVAMEKLKKAFSQYKMLNVVKKGEVVDKDVFLVDGKYKNIKGVAEKAFLYPVPVDKKGTVKKEVFLPEKIKGEIREGQKLGEMVIKLDNDVIGKVDIVSPVYIPKANLFTRFIQEAWPQRLGDMKTEDYTMLKNKEIIVGITGGIAAYKTVELIRSLTKKRANVHVVMTKNAMEFVTPLTFQTVSGNTVIHEMFELFAGSKIGHITLSDIADLLVIAPATANIIGKIANGIADDFLTTMVMATTVPVFFVPSMNTKMWESPMVQVNIEKLKNAGYELMEPASGDLACGTEGKGRLPTIEEILEKIEDIFTDKDLAGEKILITAGPTVEFIDPVRCITNISSGKMGYAMAKIARRRGAEVTLITGPTAIELPRNDIPTVRISSACDMRRRGDETFQRRDDHHQDRSGCRFQVQGRKPSEDQEKGEQQLPHVGT